MNYSLISDALAHYHECGYVYIEDAPWVVGKTAYYATKPQGIQGITDFLMTQSLGGITSDRGYLVASGEQSFLQLLLDGQPLKRAMCVTPCFRPENQTDWKKEHFMKLELINADNVDHAHLIHMIHEAATFFERFFEVRVIKTGEDSYDLVDKNRRMELGSYGIRKYEKFSWIYGTGCAEPRLSTTIERTRK